MRAVRLKPMPPLFQVITLLIAWPLFAFIALFLSACATKSSQTGNASLRVKLPETYRIPCDRPAPLTDEQLVILAGMLPMDTDKFWGDRDLAWEGYMAKCESRGDTLVKAIDDFNRLSDELDKERRK